MKIQSINVEVDGKVRSISLQELLDSCKLNQVDGVLGYRETGSLIDVAFVNDKAIKKQVKTDNFYIDKKFELEYFDVSENRVFTNGKDAAFIFDVYVNNKKYPVSCLKKDFLERTANIGDSVEIQGLCKSITVGKDNEITRLVQITERYNDCSIIKFLIFKFIVNSSNTVDIKYIGMVDKPYKLLKGRVLRLHQVILDDKAYRYNVEIIFTDGRDLKKIECTVSKRGKQ